MTDAGLDPNEIEDDAEDGDEADLCCGLVVIAGKEICLNAGTEWCDWDCPHNSVQEQTIRRREREKPPGPLLEMMERKP